MRHRPPIMTFEPHHDLSRCSALTSPASPWHAQLMKWARLAVLLCPLHQLRVPGACKSLGQQQGLHLNCDAGHLLLSVVSDWPPAVNGVVLQVLASSRPPARACLALAVFHCACAELRGMPSAQALGP